jgi:hypothetical protein
VLGSTNDGRDSQTGGSLKSQGNFLKRWLGRSARNLHTLSDKQGKRKNRCKSEPNLGPRHLNAVLLNDEQLTTTTNSNYSSEIR